MSAWSRENEFIKVNAHALALMLKCLNKTCK